MRLHFRRDDDEVTVDVVPEGTAWRLDIDGRRVPLQATRERDGSWLVETPEGRRRLWVASRGDERLVFCDGKVHTLRLPDPAQDEDEVALVGGPHLVADMPGKVVQVPVVVGQTVTAGQTVVIMESMKMETELAAAVAGTVAVVHVAAGDVVAQGAPLIDIIPAEQVTSRPQVDQPEQT